MEDVVSCIQQEVSLGWCPRHGSRRAVEMVPQDIEITVLHAVWVEEHVMAKIMGEILKRVSV